MKKIVLLIIVMSIKIGCYSQTQMEMNQQALNDYKKADVEMTVVYKKALKKMAGAKQKQMIIQAQKDWIKYKEAHCKSVADLYEGGSMQPLIYNNCLAELTRDRAKELQVYFDNE